MDADAVLADKQIVCVEHRVDPKTAAIPVTASITSGMHMYTYYMLLATGLGFRFIVDSMTQQCKVITAA